MENLSIFDCLYPKYKVDKPIRLIELFAGYGSQALALKYLGVPFEHWKICEWNYKSCNAYKRIHFGNDNTDYSKDLTKGQSLVTMGQSLSGIIANLVGGVLIDTIGVRPVLWMGAAVTAIGSFIVMTSTKHLK